jgi:hypothetical protein
LEISHESGKGTQVEGCLFVAAREPRQARKVEHDLVEMLVVAVVAVLCGADAFIEKKTVIAMLECTIP